MIIFAWLYYSSYYILISILITLVMNRLLNKLWLTPLLINAIAALLLLTVTNVGWIDREAATYAMYFNYVPVVLTSIVTNLVIYIRRKYKKDKKGKYE
ncbi:MAG: hypothetical protein Q4D77_01250 [Peptostreptococcaceae bacterium]|nr:hypothetical protein [Peptostreptococcaceae bacterium]